jgi:hypothetical protein
MPASHRKPMKNIMILPFALSLAAIMLIEPVFAGVIPTHDIQITENSSTSLSATYDGSAVTVLNTAPDRWTITFAPTIQFSRFTLNGYTEPDGTHVNIIDTEDGVGGFGTNRLFVLSDVLGGSFIPDGTTITQGAFDSGNPARFDITFHDAAAESGVPETGSTFGLLFLALMGLLAATRFCSLRLA